MWEPISLTEIQTLISNEELALTGETAKLWKLIKIDPLKWQEVLMGKEGGGFWFVAIIGMTVIWYNDIEEGFNISSYTTFGVVSDYGASQDELNWVILCILNS